MDSNLWYDRAMTAWYNYLTMLALGDTAHRSGNDDYARQMWLDALGYHEEYCKAVGAPTELPHD